MIYLDNNATTPIHPAVVEAMSECWLGPCFNPASQHRAGRRAERVLEDAREAIAVLLGADPAADRVIFTSGGTEANNLSLLGLNSGGPGKVVISGIEHPSVTAAADELARRGVQVERLRVSGGGVASAAHLEQLLADSPTRLVSVMLVNNETGVIQPVEQLDPMCRAAGVPLHTDAVQGIGKLPVSFRELGVAAMTIAPHKFHGPVGIGALVVRAGWTVHPALFGGAQQLGARPGTEPVALAAGMRRALELARDELHERRRRLQSLRDQLESRILAELPRAVVIGRESPRAPHTSNIAFPGADRQAALMALDMAGIACSTGSACASGSSEPSPVLAAMGCDEALIRSALRFSLGATTTADEIEEAAGRITRTIQSLLPR